MNKLIVRDEKVLRSNVRMKRLAKVRSEAATWAIMAPALLLLLFLVWRPMTLGVLLSFCKLQGYSAIGFVGLDNYINVISDPLFLRTLLNTFLYVVWSIAIGYLPPVIIAIMLNEVGRGQSVFKTLIYLPIIIPGIAVSMIWLRMYHPDSNGLFNQFLSIFGIQPLSWLQNGKMTIPLILTSMTWRGMGSTMLLYIAALRGIDQQLYEAARIDGAGAFRRIFKITLPQIVPIMMLMLIKQIIGIFQIMTEPMTMTGGGPNNASLSLSLTSYQYAFQLFKTESALATGSITFVILLAITTVYLWAQKRFDAN